MAKLEFYRQQVVPRIATPSARGLAAVESPLAQVAGSITQGATALAKLSADLDEMRVEDAYNTLRTKQTELMMNPETGFMSKRSADAVAPDFMSRYVTDFDKEAEALSEKLQNPQQRELFSRRAAASKAEFSDSIMRHVLGETTRYSDDVYAGVKATEINSLATNWKDPAKIRDSLSRIVANTASWADRRGLTGDALLAEQVANMSSAHATVVQSALDAGDFEYARKYFEDNKGQISAPVMSKIESALDAGAAKDQSLKLALDLTSSGMSYKDQRKQLKDMYTSNKISAEVYDQTTIRINGEEVRAKQAEAEFNDSMSGRAQEWILNNPGKSVVDMPPNLYNWAKNKGQLDTLNRFASSNGEVTGDNAEFTRLYVMGADNPIEFIREFDQKSNELRTVLSKSQYNSLLTRRGAIGKADLQGQQASMVAAATVKSLRGNLLAAGLDVTPKEGSPEAAQFASFESQLIQAIEAKTEQEGRALTLNETRKIGLDLLREGRLPGAGFFGGDTKVRRFEATEADLQRYGFRYNYEDIPPEDQKRLYRIIQTRSDVRNQLGIALTPNKTITSADFARGIELLYAAELDGVTF
jgi:hypothetical protein